jgi:hypothetical protein
VYNVSIDSEQRATYRAITNIIQRIAI